MDEQEQADCYEALFSQLWETQQWLEGVYWWNWEVDVLNLAILANHFGWSGGAEPVLEPAALSLLALGGPA